MEHPLTVRCNAAERAAFNARRIRQGPNGCVVHVGVEPALGDLDERLGIIIRRLGGQTHPKRLSAAELAKYRVSPPERVETQTDGKVAP